VTTVTESLGQLSTVFPRRFLFNALLPTLVFASTTALSVSLCFNSPETIAHWWTSTDTSTKVILGLAYLAAIWFLASAVASQWRGIIRIYEGYPLKRLMKNFARKPVGVQWHQGQLRLIAGLNGDRIQAYYRYPHERHLSDVLPTRLGNILLAAERYSLDHYGLDSIIFWPRLFPLLPDQVQRDYEEFVLAYEFPFVLSFLSAISTATIGTALIASQQSPVLFAAVVLGGFAVAYGAYLLGLNEATELGEQQKSAFDLYRGLLLEAWPSVDDVQDEKAAFVAIRRFVLDNTPPTWGAAQSNHHTRRS
jgi:hypothetical protein